MLKNLCFLFVLFQTAASSAQTVSEAQKIEESAERFALELRPLVKPLDRDLVTFHYEANNENFRFQNLEQVQNYVQRGPNRFFNPELSNSDVMGIGTYSAIDPLASRAYGQMNPMLFVLSLREGANVLNATTDTAVRIAGKANDAIDLSLHCTVSGDNTSLESLIGGLRRSPHRNCRLVVIRTMEKLNVGAILYSFMGFSIKGCRDRREALNIISSDAIRNETMALYTNTEKFEGKKMGVFISGIANGILRKLMLPMPNSTFSIPKSAEGAFVPIQALRSWTKRNLYKCGDERDVEK